MPLLAVAATSTVVREKAVSAAPIVTESSKVGVSYFFIILLAIVIIIPAIIVAQYFILKNPNIRFGLILPFVWFAISIIILAIGSFGIQGDLQWKHLLLLLFLNIPTGIMLLMMYIKNGKNKQKKNEVDISKIKDLDQ